jgi:hypothetical protein
MTSPLSQSIELISLQTPFLSLDYDDPELAFYGMDVVPKDSKAINSTTTCDNYQQHPTINNSSDPGLKSHVWTWSDESSRGTGQNDSLVVVKNFYKKKETPYDNMLTKMALPTNQK